MKKLCVRCAIFLLGLFGVAIANNVIALKLHPLEFYYTPSGLLFSLIVVSVEALFLYPAAWWYIKKMIKPVIPEESTKKES